VGCAADSDEQALRDAGATEILHSLDQLSQLPDLDRHARPTMRASMIARTPIAGKQDG
jgi:hypothetical protein